MHESQVSRDERNEYHGIAVERVSKILDALGVSLKSQFEQPIVRGDDGQERRTGWRVTRLLTDGAHVVSATCAMLC